MSRPAGTRVVVVGGGTAGCMLVSHLANHTEADIVLIEPGGVSPHDDNTRFFDVLADGELVTVVNGVQQARVLGGGSAVNGMLLTGDEPTFAHGLTRMATSEDIGVMGRLLLSQGGRFCRLWWNGGRWNPGRAVRHLEEEGRIRIVRDEVLRLTSDASHRTCICLSGEVFNADVVVLCAGAMRTPRILVESGLMKVEQAEVKNHLAINFVIELTESQEVSFDTAVVREIETGVGYQFLVHAYERLSIRDHQHGLLSIVHMNPTTPGIDFDAMEVALRELCAIANEAINGHDFGRVVVDADGTELKVLLAMSGSDRRSWLQQNVVPVSHPSSSCVEVTDGDGRVKGAIGVWVADASVLRSIPSCTPAAPVTMEALRIAGEIAKDFA